MNMSDRPLAYVCSPLRGDIEANTVRARKYSRQVFEAGYCPITPHIYFTQFLKDDIQEEREAGMKMGESLLPLCSNLVICDDKITEGMAAEIKLAEELNIPTVAIDELIAADWINSKERSEKDTGIPLGADETFPVSAYICNANGGIWQGFPTTSEALQAALGSIGGYTESEPLVNITPKQDGEKQAPLLKPEKESVVKKIREDRKNAELQKHKKVKKQIQGGREH